MHLKELTPGDMIYAARAIYNDGSHPEVEPGSLIAEQGTRGVLINIGHLEEDPSREIYLVRFDSENSELTPPIGCWSDELSAEPDITQPEDS